MNQYKSALNVLFYLVCLGIVYGSLFPFQFSLTPDREVIDDFLVSWRTVSGRGDILGNIALFIPYGLLAHVLVTLPGPGRRNVKYFVWVWLLVAAGSQLVQVFVPGRDPSIFDLYCNMAGAALGWGAWRFIPAKTASGLANVNLPQQVSLLLPLLWLASELIPFVPTIDFQAYKNSLKPLFLYPHWLWYDTLLQASSWLVCFYLLERYSSLHLPLRRLLPGMIAVVLLKIVIVKNTVSVTDLVAMGAALLLWVPLSKRDLRPRSLAYVLLFSVLVSSLFPFYFRVLPVDFGWIPFSGFLRGSMLTNATALCEKLFVFGSMAFLVQQHAGGWKTRSLLIAFVLALVECMQIWIGSGTPEMTDPLLFLGVAWLYSSMGKQGVVPQGPGRVNVSRSRESDVGHTVGKNTLLSGDRKSVAIIVAIYCVSAIAGLQLVLGMKGVPYNVRDIFGGRGDVFDFLFFCLALLSIGWGSAWLGRVLASTEKASFAIPVSLFKLIVVIYLFLWLSVTGESFRDILGANVFDRRLEEGAVLGQSGVRIVRYFGIDTVRSVTDFFEPIVRFAALLGPLLLMAGFAFAVMQRRTWPASPQWSSSNRFIAASLWIFPWLYLGQLITFDLAATDNLSELVATGNGWSAGGGFYLYLLVLSLVSLAAMLVWGFLRKSKALLVSLVLLLASLPVTWFLLNHGLEQNILKYGRTFSAVNFLLGPDRRGLISGSELFFRWSFVQAVFVGGIAFSAILYLRWSQLDAPAESRKYLAAIPVELRVYTHQCEFLHSQAEAMNLSVGDFVHSIIAYFGREIAISPDSIAAVQGYLDHSAAGGKVSLAPEEINVELTPEAREILAAIDPLAAHSESRIFRKLLEIFMAVAHEQSDKP